MEFQIVLPLHHMHQMLSPPTISPTNCTCPPQFHHPQGLYMVLHADLFNYSLPTWHYRCIPLAPLEHVGDANIVPAFSSSLRPSTASAPFALSLGIITALFMPPLTSPQNHLCSMWYTQKYAYLTIVFFLFVCIHILLYNAGRQETAKGT